LLPLFALSQKEIVHQQQIWYRYSLKIPIGTKWQIRQEFDDRNFINPSRQSQFFSRTHIERKLGKGWDVALGFAYFIHSQPQDPNVDFTNRNELRPSVEIAKQSKLSDKWSLNNRFWAESRYIEINDGSHPFSNFRFRYKIEGHYAVTDILDLFAFNELHINAGKKIVINMFEQNRYGLGVQFEIVKNMKIEVAYINWFQQQSTAGKFYERDIFRFALNQVIPIKSKQPE
nr:DUF2490 domain-containing protein [Bacteroidota bacterium]